MEAKLVLKRNPLVSEEGNHHEERRTAMANQAREASQLPVPDRYYAEYVRLPSGPEEGASLGTLQEAFNRGSRQSWKVVGVTQDPKSREGVFVVWDTAGFISG